MMLQSNLAVGVNHYCTYFDRGFLIQGLALWRSLARHDEAAILWVLALDDFSASFLTRLGDPRLNIVSLVELELGDPELAGVKAGRTRIEYYFTLSPCWPRWLLARRPEIERLTYLDADLFFFASPAPIFSAMDAAGASVLVTAHRFPPWLRHYERHGRYNVGVLSFRADAAGRKCLDDWRRQCLAWCHDRLEDDRYADQKYLDAWPERFGSALLVMEHCGVNAAPWNWGGGVRDAVCDVRGLVVFHFARFRPLSGDRWWQSGQLDYGVMPQRRRRAIYSPYWHALKSARAEIASCHPGFDFPRAGVRLGRQFYRALPLRLVFGGDWIRIGDGFYNVRFGLGRWSGRILALLRNVFLAENRASGNVSHREQHTAEE
jgi:hypothetical protein